MAETLKQTRSAAPPAVGLSQPKPVSRWALEDVLAHLEYAVNLEIWTIPYYLTAMYSIKDNSQPAFRLIQSVVHQEMLHAELAANVYNSFQQKTKERPVNIGPFRYTYEGGVPHLKFDRDTRSKYGRPDACLGPLDKARLDTMCLIELPESHPPSLDPKREKYATLGDFYTALRFGMQQHADAVRGNHNQVDYFGSFYRNLSHGTVTENGSAGLNQALRLVDVITEQGEGSTNTNEEIPLAYQNTADGYDESSSHFRKFNQIRDAWLSGQRPETYSDKPKEGPDPLLVLKRNFTELIQLIADLFNGKPVGKSDGKSNANTFGALMPTVGANVLACWRQGFVPEFPDVGSKA